MLKKYKDIIQEQENRGFIERVDESSRAKRVHYIPHHGVEKNSTTTPIRIVYDCSCRQSERSPSLNDCLESTPPELNDLTTLLLRFRLGRYNPKSQLVTYRFRVVLFGATCSPFILNATLLKHMTLNASNPAANIITRDLYVDNVISNFQQEQDLLTYFRYARALMSEAGFNLRSWTSNSSKLCELAVAEKVLDKDKVVKVLGMLWDPDNDEMSFVQRTIVNSERTTKRSILKQTSKLYDPLGLLSPVTVRAKLLVQELWKKKFDWDTPLPVDIINTWADLSIDLNSVIQTKFQRPYFPTTENTANSADFNLHVFVDASARAYGAVAYLTSGHTSTLVFAKNRVAPVKEITLPRLELMAALIGARVTHHVSNAFTCKKITCWSDSQIVLKELRLAEGKLIETCQQQYFPDVIQDLKSQKKRSPIIRQLRLYLDKDGCIRCGGRIHNAQLPETTRFPFLMSPKSHVTRLIIEDAHYNQLHAGVAHTVTHLRQKYWIPSIRQHVKSVLRRCVICRKVTGRPYTAPDPPPLPVSRVIVEPPFSVTGVDFTGALYIKEKQVQQKVYICLFTCAKTRAIHLEIVPDLTEESFMLAFRRFISRRSLPRLMISDNGTTFHAAANQIRRLYNSQNLHTALTHRGTHWQFIPKRAPWFGGMWERLIGVMKTAIKKVLGKASINLQTLQTIVTEVEAMMNDRPITYVSSARDDPEPLTPSHLLHGRRLTTLPFYNTVVTNDTPGYLINHYWHRWKHEYLTSLRVYQRSSGTTNQTIQVGDVVIVQDDFTPRLQWSLAVVDELLTGNDGFSRAARIRTSGGLTTRPIIKLYPLEIIQKPDE
ncbi:uncharacterized protein LOC132719352 [Ruditapes philippinarum]|uniref:uncharacterized protein LOC132719352 n=1 Tax=Ruditapes philippinarum TaxID=129788 RepID=UPI00295AD02D|nr:uncharacterized protein LOC132719352 [Ruditapes philippinarum]